jgi:mannose-6-phosphate isomerase-like protein (cupin superfamily)
MAATLNRTEKPWGHSDRIEWNGFTSLHRALVKAGHRCSKHFHANKWNGFYIESGRLNVRVWDETGERIYEMVPGGYLAIEPGVAHRFESLTDTVLFELYWPAEQAEDIFREDEGGRL